MEVGQPLRHQIGKEVRRARKVRARASGKVRARKEKVKENGKERTLLLQLPAGPASQAAGEVLLIQVTVNIPSALLLVPMLLNAELIAMVIVLKAVNVHSNMKS